LGIAQALTPSYMFLSILHSLIFWKLVGGGLEAWVPCLIAMFGLRVCDSKTEVHAASTGDVFGNDATKTHVT
jgi:hypothetical protein